MIALVVFLCLAGMVAPILVDAHHWWPRKPKRELERNRVTSSV
jgi:hypothetical protein